MLTTNDYEYARGGFHTSDTTNPSPSHQMRARTVQRYMRRCVKCVTTRGMCAKPGHGVQGPTESLREGMCAKMTHDSKNGVRGGCVMLSPEMHWGRV